MVASSSPESRTFMGDAALASLFPFLLFFFGHCFSLSFVVVDYLKLMGTDGDYYPPVDGGTLGVPGYRTPDAFLAQVMAVAFVSHLLLCLSTVSTVSASSSAVDPSGRRLSLLKSLSKARALWREPSSAARLYFTFLFLGYLLSLLTVLASTLVAVGDALSLGTWHLLVSLLFLFAFLYVGILRSVGPGGLVAAAEEGGHDQAVAKAPWSTALALMEESKLQGFFVFFLSLVVVHGVLLTYWICKDYFFGNRWVRGEGFYEAPMRSIQYSTVMLPLLMNTVWMLGACRLFGCLGVLLQVC